jgi:hypothetical protein
MSISRQKATTLWQKCTKEDLFDHDSTIDDQQVKESKVSTILLILHLPS